jgi:RHS repeat-associated protein
MKTTRSLTLAMTMAMGVIAGLQASVIEHQPPAPLPEFKTPEQLAKWRADQNQKTQTSTSSQEGGVFYTGKPYLAESGSYAFKYREYNPEMGRWTTIDPSGFPDGANNRMYAASPTSELDNNGLSVQNLTLPIQVTYAVNVPQSVWTDTGIATFNQPTDFTAKIDIAYTITTTTGAKHQSIAVGGWSYHDSPVWTWISQNLLDGWSAGGFTANLADHFNMDVSNTSTSEGHPKADISWSYTTGGSLSYGLTKGGLTTPASLHIFNGTVVASGKASIIAE